MTYSFEGLEDGDSRAETSALPFTPRGGTVLGIDTGNAFCGKASMFFRNTYANSELGLGNGKRWMTKSSRFVCMAYRYGLS